MKVAIIGNGIAGVNVASGLRADSSVEVTVYAAEAHPFYSRVRLPEVISGASAPEAIRFYPPDWYAKKGIVVREGAFVASIDRDAKTLTLSTGETCPWDCLVLATGASSNRPTTPGADGAGVFTLRTMEDALAIRASALADPSSASVIGGGLLGLEAARAMRDAGAKTVRVFEIAPRLLPRQLDDTGAALLSARFAAMGIEVVCGAEVAEFRPGSITLKDGRSFASATTLLSMGVHSNVDLARAAGLTVNRGIVVDSRMQTSSPSIYAVGDCAEFGGIVWGIIPAALEQAPVAAKSILSVAGLIPAAAAPEYAQTVPKTALKVGDIELMSLGKAVPSPEEIASGKVIEFSRVMNGAAESGVELASQRYEKYVLEPRDGATVLVGAILYGAKDRQQATQKMMGQAVKPEEL